MMIKDFFIIEKFVFILSNSILLLLKIIKNKNKTIFDEIYDNIKDFKKICNALIFYIFADCEIYHKNDGLIYIMPLFLKERLSYDSDDWINYVDYIDKKLFNKFDIINELQYYIFNIINKNENIDGVKFNYPIRNYFSSL